MKNKYLIFILSSCFIFFINNKIFAKIISIDASIKEEFWYASWYSEGGLEKQGVDLDYHIKPSIVYGYSISVACHKKHKLFTNVIVNIFTSKIKKKINKQISKEDQNKLERYYKIKLKIDQLMGDNSYFYIGLMHAKFQGKLTINRGASLFNIINGASWKLNSKWYKVDIMYISNGNRKMLLGIGLRYISYNKPEAVNIFKENKNAIDENPKLISGQIIETKFWGYYFLCGLLDKSYIGIPTDSDFFYDLICYLGTVYAENNIIGKIGGNNGIGGGIECNLGVKYYHMFSKLVRFTARVGYRFLYNKMGVYNNYKNLDKNENDMWEETITIDTWYGPFLDILLTF